MSAEDSIKRLESISLQMKRASRNAVAGFAGITLTAAVLYGSLATYAMNAPVDESALNKQFFRAAAESQMKTALPEQALNDMEQSGDKIFVFDSRVEIDLEKARAEAAANVENAASDREVGAKTLYGMSAAFGAMSLYFGSSARRRHLELKEAQKALSGPGPV